MLETKTIRWQCRRGMLELDMLLLSFFDECYEQLSSEGKQDFCDLLERSDQELYQWLIGRETPSNNRLQSLLKTIREAKWKK